MVYYELYNWLWRNTLLRKIDISADFQKLCNLLGMADNVVSNGIIDIL